MAVNGESGGAGRGAGAGGGRESARRKIRLPVPVSRYHRLARSGAGASGGGARRAAIHPAVANYYTAGGACSAADEWRRRFRNSFHAEAFGRRDALLPAGIHGGFRPGPRACPTARCTTTMCACRCSSTARSFARGCYESPVESVDVAPTLARAMGVAAPSSSVGRVLGEAVIE